MKRTPLRRKSKSDIKKIQDKIWEHCKRIIRARYGNTCYTCNKSNLSGINWHTGHLFAKASLGAFLKYDLRVLRPQCYNCNMNLGGMGAVFIEKMRKIEGNRYVNQIIKDRQKTVNAMEHYTQILAEYQTIQK